MLVSLDEILKDTRKGGYAVGLFNTIDTDMLEAVIGAAEELRSPVIIGTAEVLLPYGELKLLAPSLLDAAKRASVPVTVHFDHGLTEERCLEALRLGFSGVMFDGSVKPIEENLAQTREMAEIAHASGAGIEGEIGHVGEAASGDGQDRKLFTTPEEARDFIKKTGVDALAIAVGTAHGVYKAAPKVDFERIREIADAVDTPLVLHGGSGLSDDDFRRAVASGISKINVFTDLCLAGAEAMKEGSEKGLSYLEIRSLRVDKIKDAVKKKIGLFGSAGKG